MTSLLCALVLAPIVTFRCEAPQAKEVKFAGDYFGWDSPQPMKSENGAWTIAIDLPPDARIEYKFVVDGNWILDPKNPKKLDNGVGGENSVFEGPRYRLHTNEGEPKRPMKRTVLSIKDRDVIVFAPEPSLGLPILVYADGQNYEKYGKIQNVVQNLVEARKIKPVVLCLIPPKNRFNEYGADWKEYAALLFGDVLPAVRKLTGASDKGKDLYVGGSSMGGLISLRLAEEFPGKVDGGVHSQSGAFVDIRPGLSFKSLITPAKLKEINPKTRLWFCWGTYERELTKANQEAVQTMRSMKRPFGMKVTNEGHNWTAWRNRMEAGLIYLLKP